MKHDTQENIVEIVNLSFSYLGKEDKNHLVLKDISLNIHRGDYLGIIGPNGGGKTTFIKLILGLLETSFGNIKLFGIAQRKFKERFKIAYVAQKVDLDPKFPATVYEVVSMARFPLKGVFGSLNKLDFEKVDNALKEVDMYKFKTRLIGDLSGGQLQRVLIAKALAQDPELIFLDEPTSGVDTSSQEKFYEILRELNKKLGITLVLVSHDVDVVAREVTEIAAINQKLIFYGDAKDFIKDNQLRKIYSTEVAQIIHNHV